MQGRSLLVLEKRWSLRYILSRTVQAECLFKLLHATLHAHV